MRKRQLRPESLLRDVDHDLARGGFFLDRLVSLRRGVQQEADQGSPSQLVGEDPDADLYPAR